MKLCIRSNKKVSIFFRKKGVLRGGIMLPRGAQKKISALTRPKTAPSTQRLSYTTLVTNQMFASDNVSKIDD